jgi:hypothetical protein
MEGISYCLPLIYISKTKSFRKTYDTLKNYFGKNNEGSELAFFKKFLKDILKDEGYDQTSIRINFNCINIDELKPEYYKIYLRTNTDEAFITDRDEDEYLEFSFLGFYSFLISLRNRYFHFLQGTWQTNIQTREIIDPNLFFEPIIDSAINFVSIILFEVIKHDIDNT